MTTHIRTASGFKESIPVIFRGDDWEQCTPWVFGEGSWRRTFDPGFVNLISNSRLLNGSDITVTQGKVTGLPPIYWTLGTMSAGSSYSYGNNTSHEQVKSYRFVSEASRHYYVARIHVQAGYEYSIGAFVEAIKIKSDRKVLAVVGETASIKIDVDFPSAKEMTPGRYDIQFTATTSGTVQFRIGACVDQMGDMDVIISQPQVTRGFSSIEWQPTPIVPPFYGIRLMNSYFYPENTIITKDGEYFMDMTVRVEDDFVRPLMLLGRNESSGFSGIGVTQSELIVFRNGLRDKVSSLSKEIPQDKLVGLKVFWKKSSSYVSDIRLYLNGELISRIDSSLYSGNIDSLFGYSNSLSRDITVQAFNLCTDKMLSFNVDEGSGNKIHDRNGQASLTIAGVENRDFLWIEAMSPPIITNDLFQQSAEIGARVRLFADAVFWTTAQWYKDGKIIPNATETEYIIEAVAESDYGTYHCVFKNEFAETSTSRARLKHPDDNSVDLKTEDFKSVTTEESEIITTEG